MTWVCNLNCHFLDLLLPSMNVFLKDQDRSLFKSKYTFSKVKKSFLKYAEDCKTEANIISSGVLTKGWSTCPLLTPTPQFYLIPAHVWLL